jgi:hypothetical protein
MHQKVSTKMFFAGILLRYIPKILPTRKMTEMMKSRFVN